MAISFGFYNSKNHDRVYDAEQLSAIFDGIINDGIIQNWPNSNGAFKVTAGSGMNIVIAPGRAWFNHTWTLNDASLTMAVSAAGGSARTDLVVLEVNHGTRVNSIKILKGRTTPESAGDGVWQYPLATVAVPANATAVGAITDKRGASGGAPWASPIITGGNYVAKSGDTMNGTLTLKQMRGTQFTGAAGATNTTATYGANLPAAGNAGRIFFKTVSG